MTLAPFSWARAQVVLLPRQVAQVRAVRVQVARRPLDLGARQESLAGLVLRVLALLALVPVELAARAVRVERVVPAVPRQAVAEAVESAADSRR